MPAAIRLGVHLLEDRTNPSPAALSPDEEYFLELINRARANPLAEAARFGIDLNEGLPAGTITGAPKQPLAPNAILQGTIVNHLVDLQTHDLFQHESSDGTTFGQRLLNAGYPYSAGENLAVATRGGGGDIADIDYLHQLLFVDGDVADRGHRTDMLEPTWVEAGSGFHTGPFAYSKGGKHFDSAFVGNDFGANSSTTHYVTGVVYNDVLKADNFYTPGEGYNGVTITAYTAGEAIFSDTTNAAGGYRIALPPGTFDITASGGGLPAPVTFYNVAIGGQNVKLDFRPGGGQASPPGWGLAAGDKVFAVGADAGGIPLVKVFSAANGVERFHFAAYDPTFRGGVRVAMADMNGDGVPDIITAPGQGGGPNVRIYNGATFGLLANFMAFGANFSGGVQIAAGNFDADSALELAVGAGPGGGPNVRVFDIAGGSATQMSGPLGSFYAYSAQFAGGVNVAAGNVDGAGGDELITGAGVGGGPHVQVFKQDGSVLTSFFAYLPTFTGGVFVAAGDLNGDGKAEIVTGTGYGGGPHVKEFNGQTGAELAGFMAYSPNFNGGARVAVIDTDGDGRKEIVTGPGLGGGPHVRVWDAVALAERRGLFAYDPGFVGGVWVG